VSEHDERQTAGITTRLIVGFIRHEFGPPGVERLLALAGDERGVAVLEDESSWSTYRQKIALFDAAETLTRDPWVARRIGEAVLDEQLGALPRLVIGALGSPEQVLRSIARANGKFSTSSIMRTIRTESGGGVVAYRLKDRFVPSRHDCRYNQGLLSQMPVLFGLQPAVLVEQQCQVDGAPECIYELAWTRWRRFRRRTRATGIDDVEHSLRLQVADLERTVADLVSAVDVEQVLTRIAARAAVAVRAQAHLLAVEIDGRPAFRADGLDDDVAATLGAQLLAGGEVRHDDGIALSVAIASSRRHHGYLAAFLSPETGFLPADRDHLETYAALAAAALDVATSVQQLRRSDAISNALLGLSRQLAHEDDERVIADHVAATSTVVAGARRTMVVLRDGPHAALRGIAVGGFEVALERESALAFAWDDDAASPGVAALLQGGSWRSPGDGSPIVAGAPGSSESGSPQPVRTPLGAGTVVAVPIRAGQQIIGSLLALFEDQPEELRARTGRLAGIADQAGLAIDRSRSMAQALHAATHDPLTGLAGRALFTDRVEQALLDNARSGRRALVAFIDLDGFKALNDTFGHGAGDEMLVTVARGIEGVVRGSDTVARMSGDEFGVLIRDLTDDPEVIERFGRLLVESLRHRCAREDVERAVTGSVGLALSGLDGDNAQQLIAAADVGMYRAKRDGDRFERASGAAPRAAAAVGP
jgi:diguanylate cyclase (GGDEF)-like protein